MSDFRQLQPGAGLTAAQLKVDNLIREAASGPVLLDGGSARAGRGWLGSADRILRRMRSLDYRLTPDLWSVDQWFRHQPLPEELKILPPVTAALESAGVQVVEAEPDETHPGVLLRVRDEGELVEVGLRPIRHRQPSPDEVEAGMLSTEELGLDTIETVLYERRPGPEHRLDYAVMRETDPVRFAGLLRTAYENHAFNRAGTALYDAASTQMDEQGLVDPTTLPASFARAGSGIVGVPATPQRASDEEVGREAALQILGRFRQYGALDTEVRRMGVLDDRREEAAQVMLRLLVHSAVAAPEEAQRLGRRWLSLYEDDIYDGLDLERGPLAPSVVGGILEAVQDRGVGF
jgi:hypothetical protein